MITTIINVVLIGLVGFYAYEFYRGYRAATGTLWERLVAGAKGSATILWARFVQVVAALTTWLVSASDLLNAPSVGQAIQTYLKPEYVAAAFVLIAVISEVARRRGGSSGPVV